jgi:hypothetical protein
MPRKQRDTAAATTQGRTKEDICALRHSCHHRILQLAGYFFGAQQ